MHHSITQSMNQTYRVSGAHKVLDVNGNGGGLFGLVLVLLCPRHDGGDVLLVMIV